MSKNLMRALIAGLLLFGAVVMLAPSQNAVAATTGTEEYWTAAFYTNPRFEDEPAGFLQHESIAFDWGVTAPFRGANPTNWAMRWTRNIELSAGTYRLVATMDDGMVVRIDGEVVINAFQSGPARTVVVDKTLSAGRHFFQVDYYQTAGEAVAFFNIVPVSTQSTIASNDGWYGQYYPSLTLGGIPSFTRVDPEINFDWGGGKPTPALEGQDNAVPSDKFAVRWTRSVNLSGGNYLFHLVVDDGARLYVNNTLVLDVWDTRQAEAFDVIVTVPGGATNLRLDYFENTANATVQLTYFPTDTASTVSTGSGTGGEVGGGGTPGAGTEVGGGSAPAAGDPGTGGVFVDNTSASFMQGGPSTDWLVGTGGYNGSFLTSQNSFSEAAYYNWARWFPSVGPGTYDIYVYIPATGNLTSAARYWVRGTGGYTQVIVDQAANAGQWVSLGTFGLNGDGYDFVSVSDVTGETNRSTVVAFDAVQFVQR